MDIPYAVDIRPDTGVSNSTLGIWLFLASEAMLFGALFSSYALLRAGSLEWPRGVEQMNLLIGGINVGVMMGVSVLVSRAKKAALSARRRETLAFLGLTLLGALLFMLLKGKEYAEEIGSGHYASTNTFFAVYYLLTGMHALHVIGGAIATGWLMLFRVRPMDSGPSDGRRAGQSVACLALYWYFVDAIWLLVFGAVYLL